MPFDHDDDIRRDETDTLLGLSRPVFDPPDPDTKVGQARPYCVNRPWTDRERHLIVALAVKGYTTREIAELISRSEGATQVYFSTQLGLKPSQLRALGVEL